MENSNVVMDKNVTETKNTKFCKFCGTKIPNDAVVCSSCGRQVEELKGADQQPAAMPNIVINNSDTPCTYLGYTDNLYNNSNMNSNINTNQMNVPGRQMRNKWVALVLCIFLGYLGGHKFYEGKVGMGILYIFTFGLFGIGVFVDFITILMKPNPYYV